MSCCLTKEEVFKFISDTSKKLHEYKDFLGEFISEDDEEQTYEALEEETKRVLPDLNFTIQCIKSIGDKIGTINLLHMLQVVPLLNDFYTDLSDFMEEVECLHWHAVTLLSENIIPYIDYHADELIQWVEDMEENPEVLPEYIPWKWAPQIRDDYVKRKKVLYKSEWFERDLNSDEEELFRE